MAMFLIMHLSLSLSLYIGLQARSIMHFAANPIDFPENAVFPSTRMISRPVSKGQLLSVDRWMVQSLK